MCIKRNNEIDLQVGRIHIMFFSACSFKQTCYCLYSYPNSFGSDVLASASTVVNGMLGIELFLKFIYSYDIALENNGEKSHTFKTHDIRFLYKKLSDERKLKILDSLKQYECEKEEFNKFMKHHSFDFVYYRYFTKPVDYSTDYSIMIKLLDALYENSREIINDYKFQKDSVEPSAIIDSICNGIAKTSLENVGFSLTEK